MAAETELECLVSIRDIYIRREFFCQQLWILRAVGVVTGSALTGADRSVEDLHIFLYDVIVAPETKVFPLPHEEFLIVAGMRGMTGGARFFGLYRGVNDLCLFDRFRDLRMTLETEFFPFFGQQLLKRRSMRIMA